MDESIFGVKVERPVKPLPSPEQKPTTEKKRGYAPPTTATGITFNEAIETLRRPRERW